MKPQQSGQATVEFIVACLVMIPFFFGIYYFAKYSDIKQAAIQASRYAAFERSWDPSGNIKSDQVIKAELQARFFSEQAKINYHDSPAKANTKQVELWSQADQKKLISNATDVTLFFENTKKFNHFAINKMETLGSLFNLPKTNIVQAQIEVPLVNVAHFEPLKNINIKMPAAVAIGTGSWNASGSKTGDESVCARAGRGAPTSRVPDIFDTLIGAAMTPFESKSPDFGIMLPDYVPPGSLRTNNSATVTSTPLKNQTWNPCDSNHKQPA